MRKKNEITWIPLGKDSRFGHSVSNLGVVTLYLPAGGKSDTLAISFDIYTDHKEVSRELFEALRNKSERGIAVEDYWRACLTDAEARYEHDLKMERKMGINSFMAFEDKLWALKAASAVVVTLAAATGVLIGFLAR